MATDTGEGAAPLPWDIDAMVALRSDVASAAVQDGAVVLQFGRRLGREDGSLGAEALQSLALSPYAAKRLQELLNVLLLHRDRAAARPPG